MGFLDQSVKFPTLTVVPCLLHSKLLYRTSISTEISFEVTFQTRKTVLDHISKQIELNTTRGRVFLTNVEMFGNGVKPGDYSLGQTLY